MGIARGELRRQGLAGKEAKPIGGGRNVGAECRPGQHLAVEAVAHVDAAGRHFLPLRLGSLRGSRQHRLAARLRRDALREPHLHATQPAATDHARGRCDPSGHGLRGQGHGRPSDVTCLAVGEDDVDGFQEQRIGQRTEVGQEFREQRFLRCKRS